MILPGLFLIKDITDFNKKICGYGLNEKNIRILIATGLHRPATEYEITELVGKEIKSKISVISHDARSNDQTCF